MTTLSHEALLRLQGPEAAKFLQGQTTADFESAAPGAVLRGAFCDPKGRVLTDFLAAVLEPETILLRVRRAVADPILKHLQRYLMFSKADLTLSDWSVGATAEDSSGSTFLAVEDHLRVPRGEGLTEIWGPEADHHGALDQVTAMSAEIALGEARIELETMGHYLPQDLNFDLNGAVSFTKGCYTGQEIVARLHYRGTPKRRLYRALCEISETPAAGHGLQKQGEDRVIGSVVNAASAEGRCTLLVETIDGALEAGIVLTGSGEALKPWS